MLNKERVLFCAVIIVSLLDWLTTVAGILFFGAKEVNPLFSELTKSNMLLFSAVKLSAILFIGLAFNKASTICKSTTNDLHFTKRFLYGGYSLAFLVLTAVVTSNMITILNIG